MDFDNDYYAELEMRDVNIRDTMVMAIFWFTLIQLSTICCWMWRR